MKVTRDVIIDLLPIYSAGEASEDTRTLVKEFLAGDPELEKMAREVAEAELPGDAPVPLTWEDKMKAYKEARKFMLIRTIVLSVIISASVLFVLVFGGVLAAFFAR